MVQREGILYDLTREGKYLGTRLALIKNYGCYSLAIIANYHSDERLERIETILATANILKLT